VLKKELLDSDLGVTINASGLGSLRELSAAELVDDLRTLGVVRVRGAAVDVEAFRDVVGQLGLPYQAVLGATKSDGGGEININLNRDRVEIAGSTSAEIRTVNLGAYGINLHAEAPYTPLRPEVLAFYCAGLPGTGGGRTSIACGEAILRRMTDRARQEILDTTMSFEGTLSIAYIEQVTGLPFAALTAKFFDPDPRCTYELREGGTQAAITYRPPTAPLTLFGRRPAFANNLLGLSRYGAVQIEHVRPFAPQLSEETLADAYRAADASTVWLEWQLGDLVLIDNSRVMHGREPLTNASERRILIAMLQLGAAHRPAAAA
jgi:alpha-ketoglutarate-dependent taurine dioxygenase